MLTTTDKKPSPALRGPICAIFMSALIGCAQGAEDGEYTWQAWGRPIQVITEARASSSVTASSGFSHPTTLSAEEQTRILELAQVASASVPAQVQARIHGCRKVRFGDLANILESYGVNTDAESVVGSMLSSSSTSLGVANYAARIREQHDVEVATASRLFDILVVASDQVIANLPRSNRCSLGGPSVELFRSDGSCAEEGLTCLLGVPASPTHVSLCDETVRRASNPREGQRIAVASLLAANLICE